MRVRYDSSIRIQMSLNGSPSVDATLCHCTTLMISLLLMRYTRMQCHGRSSPSSLPTLTIHNPPVALQRRIARRLLCCRLTAPLCTPQTLRLSPNASACHVEWLSLPRVCARALPDSLSLSLYSWLSLALALDLVNSFIRKRTPPRTLPQAYA